MNDITEKLLEIVSDWDGKFKGAYNIRENSGCAGRQSSENIRIESKTDNPGINIFISSKAQQETVYIPACVTHGGVDDLVYNDFLLKRAQMSLLWQAAAFIPMMKRKPATTVSTVSLLARTQRCFTRKST